MSRLVTIELLDHWDRVPIGETLSLRFVVSRPADASGAVVVPASGVKVRGATLNTDLLSQDLTLHPGDTVCLAIGLRFHAIGPRNLNEVAVQVNPVGRPDHERDLIPLPDHPFRVIPSLEKSLRLALTRVCGYDDAVKVEVVAKNITDSDITDVELVVHPADCVRSGPIRRRELLLGGDKDSRFDLVVTGSVLELGLTATVDGERVEGMRTLSIPTTEQMRSDSHAQFTFLEPRALTTDRVTVVPEGSATEVMPTGGVFPVRGGKSRYVLTVFPSNPQASSVRLYAAAGQVEVEPLAKPGRQWPFLLTVVDNPTLTQVVRLDYDVQVGGSPLRGEVYLSIRPTWTKTWGLAATAGFALTLKSGSVLLTAAARSDGGFEDVLTNWHELLQRRWWDWAQLGSIPLIRGVLWVADRAWRPFQEG